MVLILAPLTIWLPSLCRADSYSAENTYSIEDKQRLSDAETYIRKQAFHGVSLLPGELRSAVSWFSGSWHAVPLAGIDGEDGDAPLPPVAATPGEPGRAAIAGDGIPVNLASNFHHKGFLPTHDALVMGMAFSRNIADDKLQFTARPFYGQNWLALQGYWGAELSMGIIQRDDGMPWGTIGIGYTGGNQNLTDQGRGIDLHGDVDLTGGFKLTTGMRQSDITSADNYVMLRWKLDFK